MRELFADGRIFFAKNESFEVEELFEISNGTLFTHRQYMLIRVPLDTFTNL